MVAIPIIMVTVFALFVVGIVLLAVFSIRNRLRRSRGRHAAFWQLAQSRGWQHLADRAAYPVGRNQPMSLHSGSLSVPDALLGEVDGAPFAISDQVYTTSDGEGHTHTYHYAAITIRLPGTAPRLMVQPENAMTRLGDKLGVRDIQLESAAFNDAFNISCQSERFASDVLNPRTMQWMLGYRKVSVLMSGQDMLVWVPGSLGLDTVDFLLWYASSLRAQVPSFVWKFLQA